MRTNNRIKKNWNKEDLTVLLWVIVNYEKLKSIGAPEFVKTGLN